MIYSQMSLCFTSYLQESVEKASRMSRRRQFSRAHQSKECEAEDLNFSNGKKIKSRICRDVCTEAGKDSGTSIQTFIKVKLLLYALSSWKQIIQVMRVGEVETCEAKTDGEGRSRNKDKILPMILCKSLIRWTCNAGDGSERRNLWGEERKGEDSVQG